MAGVELYRQKQETKCKCLVIHVSAHHRAQGEGLLPPLWTKQMGKKVRKREGDRKGESLISVGFAALQRVAVPSNQQ